MYLWLVLYLYHQCTSERTSPSNPHRLGRDHRQWGNLAVGSDGNQTKNMYSNETLHLGAPHDLVFSLCDFVPVAKGFCTPYKSLTIKYLWWMNWELSIHHINPYGIWMCLCIFRHSFLHMQWTQAFKVHKILPWKKTRVHACLGGVRGIERGVASYWLIRVCKEAASSKPVWGMIWRGQRFHRREQARFVCMDGGSSHVLIQGTPKS